MRIVKTGWKCIIHKHIRRPEVMKWTYLNESSFCMQSQHAFQKDSLPPWSHYTTTHTSSVTDEWSFPSDLDIVFSDGRFAFMAGSLVFVTWSIPALYCPCADTFWNSRNRTSLEKINWLGHLIGAAASGSQLGHSQGREISNACCARARFWRPMWREICVWPRKQEAQGTYRWQQIHKRRIKS